MDRSTVGLVLIWISVIPSISEAGELDHQKRGETIPQEQAVLASLERDTGFQVIQCLPQGRAPLEESNRAKRALYDAVVSGQGVVKIKKTCPTEEGRSVTEYFMVDAGKATIAVDGSHDPYGGGIGLYDVSSMEIGYFDGENREWHATPILTEGKRLEIQYIFSTKRWKKARGYF